MDNKFIKLRIPLWVYTQFVCKLKSEKGLDASINAEIVRLLKDELGKEVLPEPHTPKLNLDALLLKAHKQHKRAIDRKVKLGRHFNRIIPATTTELKKYRKTHLDKIFNEKSRKLVTKKTRPSKPKRKTKRKHKRNSRKTSRICTN